MGWADEQADLTQWDFSVPDWRERLAAGRTLMPTLPLDRREADRAVAIYNRLRLPDVPGQPTLGEASGDWFRELIAAIFGSMVGDARKVSGAFVLVPKKNSKTTNGGALMLTALLMNQRPNAQFGLFGPTQEISELAYQAAAGMVEADPDLKKMFQVQDHLKKITIKAGPGKGSRLKIMTFDPKIATGGKYAGWLLDEAHLLGSEPKAAKVIGQLRGARTAIPEQFGVIITTQSDDRPAGVFADELTYARNVRDGRVATHTVLPLLYEFPSEVQTDEAQPWADPAIWHQVLPNLGRSVSIDILKEEFATAKDKGGAELQRWASQHLNIEIGLALHADGWVGAGLWEAAVEPGGLEDLIADCDVCVMGVDGGGLDDLMGVAVIGRERETRRWRSWGHAWAHPVVFERRKDIAPRLRGFEASGDLTVCQEATQDIREIAALADRLNGLGLLPAENGVGLDPASIGALVDELVSVGITEAQMSAVGQGWRLSPALWTLERKLSDRTFAPCDQALMAWSVANAKCVQRGNAVAVTKEQSGKAKIDPFVALLDAAMLMSRNPEAAGRGPSFWEVMGAA